jgi:hypothetical protein
VSWLQFAGSRLGLHQLRLLLRLRLAPLRYLRGLSSQLRRDNRIGQRPPSMPNEDLTALTQVQARLLLRRELPTEQPSERGG